MTVAYRITNWRELYEVTGKGAAAGPGIPVEKLRKSPLQYVRWSVHGHSLGPTYRKMVKKAWGVGILMEMACMGLFGKLLELAADQGPKYRGWILDEKQRPINAQQIADILDIKDDGKVESLLEILCDEEINWVELVEFPLQVGASRGESGKEGESRGRLGGKVEDSLYKVTEAEGKVSLNNETERDSPEVPEVGGEVELPAAPASALVSDSVSEIPVSVSDSAPRQELRAIEEIKKDAAKIILEICELKRMRPRNQGDYTTYNDIFVQLKTRVIYETEEPLFEMALKKAKACCRVGDNARAMFVEAMKKSPFCYVPVSRPIIKGRFDKYRQKEDS